MSIEPFPDYLLPKRLRHLLWIVGGLIFYGQLTIMLLAGVGVDAAAGLRHLSAWLTLADYGWRAPSKIFISPRDTFGSTIPMCIITAVVGSLPLFVLSALRQWRFSELVLLLCIPFSAAATFFAAVAIEASLSLRFFVRNSALRSEYRLRRGQPFGAVPGRRHAVRDLRRLVLHFSVPCHGADRDNAWEQASRGSREARACGQGAEQVPACRLRGTMTNPPEQEADMLTEPYPDYLLPKRLRHLLWIGAGLIFYGQFTVLLLAGVTVDAGVGTRKSFRLADPG